MSRTAHVLLQSSQVASGDVRLRWLELTLDSLLGQTDPDFVLHADPAALGAEGIALLAAYADPRLTLDAPPSAPELSATLYEGEILLPAWLARMRAALAADPNAAFAVCGASVFDGERSVPARAVPADIGPGTLRRPVSGDPARHARVDARLIVVRSGGQDGPARHRIPANVHGRRYLPADIDRERPPTLHVVVDTEAEFDWDQGFHEGLTGVSALQQVESAQAIFDRYGIRPVYLIDYPVASQPEGIAAIQAMAGRGACAVGAHLHPWTNPPFGPAIDRHRSYPGNLPREEEAAKLDALLAVIERNFSERPVFYKAGRYGLGPNTVELIAERGAQVDYSLMPETDFRRDGGPDFRMVAAYPYEVEGFGLLTVPMTRADLGPLSRWWRLRGWLDTEAAAMLHLRGILARSGLLERLTLTPEGVSARLQIVLLETLLRRGHRVFVLHYHSPSLAAGHTPYVRTEADRQLFLARIEAVCRWFFEELGGVPGRPWDLLPVWMRSRLWR